MTHLENELPADALDVYARAALGRKARHLVVLDVHELSSVADAFLICSGTSHRQVTAIAEHIKIELKKQRIFPLGVEGLKEGHWVVMDYGHVIIHIFYEPTRLFYDIEGLWSDARRVTTRSMAEAAALEPTTEQPNDEPA